MDITIEITITNKDGENLFHSESLMFESAHQELSKAERYIAKLEIEAERATADALEEIDEEVDEIPGFEGTLDALDTLSTKKEPTGYPDSFTSEKEQETSEGNMK